MLVVIPARSVETLKETKILAPLSEKMALVIFGAGKGEVEEMIIMVVVATEYESFDLSSLDNCNDIA